MILPDPFTVLPDHDIAFTVPVAFQDCDDVWVPAGRYVGRILRMGAGYWNIIVGDRVLAVIGSHPKWRVILGENE